MPAAIDYVKSTTAPFDAIVGSNGGVEKIDQIELLWGDGVRIVGSGRTSAEARVKARGRVGYIDREHLGGESLLEIYFIDVGQGDGVLIRTPDDRHLLIDGGWPRSGQPSGKNAADFVDWKFVRDYGEDNIELDAMICSHNDQDHYGGLWDLVSKDPQAKKELNCKAVTIENFYHAGLSWWKESNKRTLGRTVDTDLGKMFIDLLDTRTSAQNALKSSANPRLQGEWAKFIAAALKAKTKAGKPTPFKRISTAYDYLPDFAPDESDVSIRVLAPIDFDVDGKPAIRYFASKPDKNTNGNSLLFRVDYGRSRILLTGDLNSKSMQSILNDWTGDRQELQCDVAKACHHGSDDVSYEFLAAMRPAVTVISSGDSEGHDHPRPGIVAASATTGYLEISKDKIVTPLIYSTELARSTKIGKPTSLSVPGQAGQPSQIISAAGLKKAEVTASVTMAGDRNPRTVKRTLDNSYIVTGLIYGLVNVRTNGERIVCATMNEKEHSWHVQEITSRF